MSKFTLYEVVNDKNWIVLKKFDQPGDAMDARNRAYLEQEEEMRTGETNEYHDYIVVME